MRLMFFLSGENIELAKSEVLALAKPKNHWTKNRLLFFYSDFKEFKRLAFTHFAYEFLFSTSWEGLVKKVKSFDWPKHYKKNFCVRTTTIGAIKGFKHSEASLADLIWETLKNPKVNLSNPSTEIHFLVDKGRVYCGIPVFKNEEQFSKRRPHLRRAFHPISMQPKLARALVNLTGVKKGETFFDPFVGTGGFLIEAGLIGCKLLGNDLDKAMINNSKINLKDFKLRAKLTNEDALCLKADADALATDMPYGISSKSSKKPIYLYEEFFKVAHRLVKKGKILVIVLPKRVRVKSKLKLLKVIPFYMHHSLTRQIFILKK